MKTYLAIPLVVAVTAGLLSSGGCVAKAEYDKVVAANRRAQDELKNSLAAQQTLRKDIELLKHDLAKRDGALESKDDVIALLEKAKGDLQVDYDDLSERYKKLADAKPPTLPTLRPLPKKLDTALKAFAEENPDLIEYLPQYGMVKLKSDLTFDKGSDFVTAEAKKALTKFVEIITSKVGEQFNVFVAGHTDDIPIRKAGTRRRHPNNWYLSVHRAVAVEGVLAKAGLAPKRIAAMGFGEYHPVVPNKAGNKGNPANRRVEIWIVPPNLFLTAPAAKPPAK